MGLLYTIVSRNYGGEIRRSWPCRLIERTDPLLVFEGEFEHEVVHPHLGRIERGTISIEYFWFDRWFNVFRFHEPNGTFRNYYCNVAMPPVLREASLDFVDLDIDLIIDSQGKVSLHDEDEYHESAANFSYPFEIETAVKTAVNDLTQMVNRRDFPFDHPDFRNLRRDGS